MRTLQSGSFDAAPSDQIQEKDGRTMLPRGITGFCSIKDPAPLQAPDEKCFRRMCYEFARENHGRILEIDTGIMARNFYFAKIQLGDSQLYLLQNICHPYIAFAESLEGERVVFADLPVRFGAFAGSVTLLTTSQLAQDWRPLSQDLGPAEVQQIHTWKPENVGEIVFNFWD